MAGPSPYEEIKARILEGKLSPEERVVASTLASELGVSRTPVREALQRLEHDGLVEREGSGLRVRGCSPEELVRIYEARIPLEVAVAGAAAIRRSDVDLLRLSSILDRYEKTCERPPEELLVLDGEFHRAIWEAGHNEVLVDLLARLRLHLGRYPMTALHLEGRNVASIEEHRELLEAITTGDRMRAEEIGRVHMSRALKARLTLWSASFELSQ